MSEIHRRRPRRYKCEFSFVGNDRRPTQRSGTRRENRKAPDSPDLSPSIPDDRGYLRFRVFISRQNLGQSENSQIPDRLGFSRHMKPALTVLWLPSDVIDCGVLPAQKLLAGKSFILRCHVTCKNQWGYALLRKIQLCNNKNCILCLIPHIKPINLQNKVQSRVAFIDFHPHKNETSDVR